MTTEQIIGSIISVVSVMGLSGAVLFLEGVCRRLKRRVQDAETSLRIYDEGRVSEYWLRHPSELWEER